MRIVLVVTPLVLHATACGGDDADADSAGCTKVEGCGGELLGVWKVTQPCGNVSAQIGTLFLPFGVGLSSECPQVVLGPFHTASAQSIDARLEFGADGRYVQSGTLLMRESYLLTAECIDVIASSTIVQSRPMPGPGERRPDSCDVALLAGLTSNGPAFECSVRGSSCRCETTQTVQFDASGSYRTMTDRLFLDRRSEGGAYCVQGQTAALTWQTSAGDGRLDLMR